MTSLRGLVVNDISRAPTFVDLSWPERSQSFVAIPRRRETASPKGIRIADEIAALRSQ